MDKSRIEPTIFFIENISFSLKLFSGHFFGHSFIKTVRGPLNILLHGNEYLSEEQNINVFMDVHNFITKSKRFNIP